MYALTVLGVVAVHIGIISCSSEGAVACLRTLCNEGAHSAGASNSHPEVSMHLAPVGNYMTFLDQGDHIAVGDLLLGSAHKLASIGADLLICPDSSVHLAREYVLQHTPLPWLGVTEVVAERALIDGYKKVGLLGSHWLIQSKVYQASLDAYGIECIHISAAAAETVDDILVNELFSGIQKIQSLRFFQQTVDELKAQGCEAVILGASEMALMLGSHNLTLPVLNPAHLLAQEALRCMETSEIQIEISI